MEKQGQYGHWHMNACWRYMEQSLGQSWLSTSRRVYKIPFLGSRWARLWGRHGNIGLCIVETPVRIPASPGMDDWQKRLQRVGCCVFSTSNLIMADFQVSGVSVECTHLVHGGESRNFITTRPRQVKYRSDSGPGLPGHSVLWLKRGPSGLRRLGNGSQPHDCLQSYRGKVFQCGLAALSIMYVVVFSGSSFNECLFQQQSVLQFCTNWMSYN